MRRAGHLTIPHRALAFAFACALAAAPSSGGSAGEAAKDKAVPRAVEIARTTEIPGCTSFVDAGAKAGDGSAQSPHGTITEAIEAAEPGAVICVAEGVYTDQIKPGEKHFASPVAFSPAAHSRFGIPPAS